MPGVVGMADRRMSTEGSFVVIAAGSGCLAVAAWMLVVGHPSEVVGLHGSCSDPIQGQEQALIDSETILGGIVVVVAAAVGVAAAVAEVCNFGSQVAIAGDKTVSGVDEDVAGKASGMQKPCLDYKVLEERSTMTCATSFAWDPLPEWMSMWI